LCYARHIGAERAEAEAAEAKAVVVPLTADQARAAAAAEGLELVPSQSGETGYRGVCKKGGGFVARVRENGTFRCLGTFRTAIEAALCYARHIGAERAEAGHVAAGAERASAEEAEAAAGHRVKKQLIIHTQFSNAPVAIYKQTIAKKKPESKFKWALPVHL
jgi:hypothetical protein